MKNFKQVFFLMAMAVAVMVSGCDKLEEDGTDDGTKGGDTSTPFVITATVSTGGVAVDTVKAFIWQYDEATDTESSFEVASGVYKNGGFTLNLPATVPAQYLQQFREGDVPDGINISDSSVKGAGVRYIEAYKGLDEVGDFWFGIDSPDIEIIAEFLYVDKDVTIIGSHTGKDDWDREWTITETYNVSLKRGWNKVYVKYIESETNKTVTTEVTNTEPSGLQWHFENYWNDVQPQAAKSIAKRRAFSFFK